MATMFVLFVPKHVEKTKRLDLTDEEAAPLRRISLRNADFEKLQKNDSRKNLANASSQGATTGVAAARGKSGGREINVGAEKGRGGGGGVAIAGNEVVGTNDYKIERRMSGRKRVPTVDDIFGTAAVTGGDGNSDDDDEEAEEKDSTNLRAGGGNLNDGDNGGRSASSETKDGKKSSELGEKTTEGVDMTGEDQEKAEASNSKESGNTLEEGKEKSESKGNRARTPSEKSERRAVSLKTPSPTFSSLSQVQAKERPKEKKSPSSTRLDDVNVNIAPSSSSNPSPSPSETTSIVPTTIHAVGDNIVNPTSFEQMLDLNSPQKAHFLPVVRSILKEFGLTNPDDVQWHPDERGDNFTVVFTVEDKVDELKDTLVSYGLGADFGRISLFPVKMSLPKRALKSKKAESSGDLGGVLAKIQETMASREIVEHVEALIEAGAVFSFDYLMLVIVASLLAAYGLAVNSSVVVVASMLVSPIMGPILAITFGAVIGKWQLVRIGLKNEILSLMICVIIGLLFGITGGWVDHIFAPVSNGFLTVEMYSRGDTTNLLLSAIMVAIPSGIGVSLSVTGSNTNSLVGVAISASLLPPAVNAGICFSYSLVMLTRTGNILNGNNGTKQFQPFLANGQDGRTLTAGDVAVVGLVSFALSIVNILCIIIMGIVFFRIKAVSDIPGKSKFWETDIAVARAYNDGSNQEKLKVLGQDALALYMEKLKQDNPQKYREMKLKQQQRDNTDNDDDEEGDTNMGGVLNSIRPTLRRRLGGGKTSMSSREPLSPFVFSGRELFAVQKPSYTVRGVRQSSSKKKKAVGSVMNLINLFNKDDEDSDNEEKSGGRGVSGLSARF